MSHELVDFPTVHIQAMPVRQECTLCKLANIDRRADWVTHNDRNAPSNPAFWCEDCYRQMHYSEEGYAYYTDYTAFYYMYELGNIKRQFVHSTKDDIGDS